MSQAHLYALDKCALFKEMNQAVMISICAYDVNALLDIFSPCIIQHYIPVTVPDTYQPTYQLKGSLGDPKSRFLKKSGC